MNWMWDNLGELVLAAGALGMAAFGIVEGLKRWRFLGEAGFPVIPRILGPILETLTAAYGSNVEAVLRAQYRGDQNDFARILRQGARIGLTPDNAARVAQDLPTIQAALLKQVAVAVDTGEDLPPTLRNVLGRYELAVDARIDAALTLAQAKYATAARLSASAIALTIALIVAYSLVMMNQASPEETFGPAVLVGLAAVPLAPIAKDVVSALKATADALRAKVS
jgi:hypothetical protein